jgi:hypothetical protein
MKTENTPRVTKTEMAAVNDLAEDTCSEPGCGITIMVEKDFKLQGRKSRCISCLMRDKVAKGEIK